MPEAAGSRNLEDILASIRQSLADETVDGLVELSAAAAAAARAETREHHGEPSADISATDEQLKDKLLGALSAAPTVPDDLDDLLADSPPSPAVVALPEARTLRETEPASAPADAAQLAEGDAASKLWFLRPGAPEPKQAAGGKDAPVLRIDPFEAGDGRASKASKDAASIFSLSPKAIVAGSPAPKPPAVAPEMEDAEVASPGQNLPSAQATTSPSAVEEGKPKVPRLDKHQIEMLNKLKSASAAAAVKAAQGPDSADMAATTEINIRDAAALAWPTLEKQLAAKKAADEATTEVAAEDEAEAPLSEATARALLSRPERATPLFVSERPSSRPIVSSPPLPSSLQGEGLPGAMHTLEPPADEAVEPSTAVAPAAREPDAAGEDGYASAVVEALSQAETPEAADPPQVAVPEIHRVKTVASLVSPPPSEQESALAAVQGIAAASDRPLEEMIASVLEPVLQRLLEKNLTPLVEAIVRQEVEKAFKERAPE